ncbi:MAG: PQQ-dependent sugar dehydrogenase [Phycisphaerales bacterium]
MKRSLHLPLAALAAAVPCAVAQLAPPAVVRPFASVLQPVMVTAPSNQTDRVYVVDRTGRIQVLNAATGASLGTFLDVRAITSTAGDGGLLCLAFSPNYATDGTFYIYHNTQPNADGVIARYHVSLNPLVADANSREIVLRYPRPIGHNGGWLGFSPLDGTLNLAVGDGGTAATPDPLNRSQNLVGSFFGKVLRIDPSGDDFPSDPDKNYSIPAGNPFVGIPGDDEVWAYGLRNPWRCSFDRLTGDFWIGDVGQDVWEEINFESAGFAGGGNYGWKCVEGTTCTSLGGCDCEDPTLRAPFVQIPHDGANCSVTGGVVYRGSALPDLYGHYLCADWCSNRLWTIDRSTGSPILVDRTTELQPAPTGVSAGVVGIGEDALGEVYLCEFFGGRVLKLQPPPCTPEFTLHPGSTQVASGETLVLSASCFGAGPMSVRWTRDGSPLSDDSRISGSATGTLTILATSPADSGVYRLEATSGCGAGQSFPATVTVTGQCPADWDGSGGVDGDDVIAFFSQWDAGNADIDGSGGTDGDDVILFFSRWDAGC